MSNTLEKLSPWLFTIGLFVLWEAACRIFKIDKFILPAPSETFLAMAQYWRPLLRHSFVTLWTTMAGFALAVAFGIVLGLIVGWSRTIYRGLYPVMIGFNCIPKVAVVPILIMWFGIGEVPAILTAFLISFFPIVVNVATGLATMEPELEDVLRALGASKLDIMLKVGIPRTQPYLFGSLKVAITLAFVGTVVSETVGANAGLGYQIALAGSNFQMPLVFAALLLLAVEGIAMYAVFAYDRGLFHPLGVPLVDERGGVSTACQTSRRAAILARSTRRLDADRCSRSSRRRGAGWPEAEQLATSRGLRFRPSSTRASASGRRRSGATATTRPPAPSRRTLPMACSSTASFAPTPIRPATTRSPSRSPKPSRSSTCRATASSSMRIDLRNGGSRRAHGD